MRASTPGCVIERLRLHMQTRYWGCRVQSPHDLWTEYETDTPLANATGGEGGIFTLKPHTGEKRVAKLYNSASKALLSQEAFTSLAILTSKYADLSHKDVLPFVAWPIEVLFTVKHPTNIQHLQTLAGITMRHISGHGVLEKLTTNGNGRFGIGTEKAVRIAAVIANYLHRMHRLGIIFCDFNPKNILVSNDHSNVTFVDADAFQHSIVKNVFTKPHYFPGYASPNHIEAKPGARHPADDNFVLAIHIFQLLLDGGHPFDTGPAYNPSGDPFATITPHDNIKARRWPYTNISLYQPPGETPKHYAKLHPELRSMFERAFVRFDPPTAAEWESVLPKFRTNVEGNGTPPPRPPTQLLAKQNTPTAQPRSANPIAKPANQHTPYTGNTAAAAVAPTPQFIPPRPQTPTLTPKILAKALLKWAFISLWRLLKANARWLSNKIQSLSVVAAKAFKKTRAIELVSGAIFITIMVWFFNQFDPHATAARSIPQEPLITARTVTTTVEPPLSPPVPQPAAPTKKKASGPSVVKKVPPLPSEPEPEVLPWLTKETLAPAPQLQSAPEKPPSRQIYSKDWNDEVARKARAYRNSRDPGWTQRGRTSEYRLAPGAQPVFRFTPSN